VAVDGSGAIEKQLDLVVGRRPKGQGMRWTRRGANRLLKLRLRKLGASGMTHHQRGAALTERDAVSSGRNQGRRASLGSSPGGVRLLVSGEPAQPLNSGNSHTLLPKG